MTYTNNTTAQKFLVAFICVVLLGTSCSSPAITQPSPATTLTEQELDNLVAYARLLGYIQYFHPSDQANDTNWENFTKANIEFVLSAVDRADLIEKLNQIFLPIAPSITIFERSEEPIHIASAKVPGTETDGLWLVAWRHYGYGGGDKSVYHSERVYVKLEEGTTNSFMPNPDKPLKVDLSEGISASIPLTLFVNEEGDTLPYNKDPVANSQFEVDTKTEYAATVILAWNVFQHFYPYFDVVQTDWASALRHALKGAYTARDDEAFLVILQEMVAQLRDGHGLVKLKTEDSIILSRPPFGWDWVDDQLVITFVEKDASEALQVGDIVTQIDGRPTENFLQDQERLISGATPQWVRFSALRNTLLGSHGSELRFTIEDLSGALDEITLERTVEVSKTDALLFTEERPAPISELKPGIWYVDLSRITGNDFNNNFTALSQATGIVYDLRGYPSLSLDPISYIIDRPVDWPQLKIPIITYPDHENISWDLITQTVKPASPFFRASVAFIADGRAISYAESYLGIIESNNIAEIVGEPTAGTNGNVASFTLFGRYTFRFTGMQVLKLDGSQHHGIGVQPTVPVNRTLSGVREGRDELLEKAIEAVSQP